jgi:hypothetical protein
MPFASFHSVDEVAKTYQITCTEADFVVPLPFTVSDHFRTELAFVFSELAYKRSEAAICETLLFPLLKEVWTPFRDTLRIWSHEPLAFDDILSGIPDYLVTRTSPLGKFIPDQPYLIVVEAKRDNFILGWGQCLAAMLAAQKLNTDAEQTIYGIVTNGLTWEFGKLQAALFTQHPRQWSLYDLNALAAALHFVLDQCKQEASARPQPA